MKKGFPRRAHPENNRYLIHKVRRARVDEHGILEFTYDDGSGKDYCEPFYPSHHNDRVPLAIEELAKNGLKCPSEIRYVVAYHCGAIPSGVILCLLRRLKDIPARYVVPPERHHWTRFLQAYPSGATPRSRIEVPNSGSECCVEKGTVGAFMLLRRNVLPKGLFAIACLPLDLCSPPSRSASSKRDSLSAIRTVLTAFSQDFTWRLSRKAESPCLATTWKSAKAHGESAAWLSSANGFACTSCCHPDNARDQSWYVLLREHFFRHDAMLP